MAWWSWNTKASSLVASPFALGVIRSATFLKSSLYHKPAYANGSFHRLQTEFGQARLQGKLVCSGPLARVSLPSACGWTAPGCGHDWTTASTRHIRVRSFRALVWAWHHASPDRLARQALARAGRARAAAPRAPRMAPGRVTSPCPGPRTGAVGQALDFRYGMRQHSRREARRQGSPHQRRLHSLMSRADARPHFMQP